MVMAEVGEAYSVHRSLEKDRWGSVCVCESSLESGDVWVQSGGAGWRNIDVLRSEWFRHWGRFRSSLIWLCSGSRCWSRFPRVDDWSWAENWWTVPDGPLLVASITGDDLADENK